jgi:hypothetical protein
MTQFSLDKALQAITERNAEAPDLSEGIGRIDQNTPEVKRRRIRQLEAAVLSQIEYLQGEPESELKTTRLNVALDRLGELRAELGDYEGAIAVTVDVRRVAEYQKVQEAIARDPSETCACPLVRVVDGASGFVTLSPRFKAQRILTEKGYLDLIRCANCGFMNAK